jgi:hypothetical protein
MRWGAGAVDVSVIRVSVSKRQIMLAGTNLYSDRRLGSTTRLEAGYGPFRIMTDQKGELSWPGLEPGTL